MTEAERAEPEAGRPPGTRPGALEKRDRAAALAAGPGKIPRKVVVIFLSSLVALAFVGVVLDHFFPGTAGTSTTTTVGRAGAVSRGPRASKPPSASSRAQLPSTQAALMGLKHLRPAQAPGFSLTDQHGHRVSLAGFRGKVVVLSFFDAACDDICPVLAKELSLAKADLGAAASRVAMVTVNTDPLTSAGPTEVPSAGYFLTGSLARLNAVWTSYGISIEVQRDTGVVSHNDFLYFIDPSGRLRLRATPYANEATSGRFSLPEATERAWGAGIAAQAKSLLPGRG